MLNLPDLLSAVLQIVATFLIVSYISSAVTDAFAMVFGWSASMLINGVKELLNDQAFNGLARAIYNDARVNPRGSGDARSEAELRFKPSYIDPNQFAEALIDSVGLRQKSVEDMETAIKNNIPSEQLRKLALSMVHRKGTDLDSIRKEIAAWFDIGMTHVSNSYRHRTQLSTFLVALALAALLDLQPLAFGSKSDGANDPFAYARTFSEWVIVALSTLFGAPFWYSLLESFLGKKPPPPPSAPAPGGAP
jgi:hypothetical protein